jgi:hypothetical protein
MDTVNGNSIWAPLVLLGLCSASALPQKQDAIDVRDLVRRAAANYEARQAQRNDYTYLAHCVWFRDDRRTKHPRTYSDDSEVMFLEGEPYVRLVRHDNQPLSPEEEKQERVVRESLARARCEGKSKGGASPSPYMPFDLPMAQLADEFDLRKKSQQRLDDRTVYVIEAAPGNDQDRGNADQERAHHFRMKLWIDAAEAQIVKVEAVIIRDIVVTAMPAMSYPIVNDAPEVYESKKLRRLYKPGTTMSAEWTRLSEGVWLPNHVRWKASDRIWWPNSSSSLNWRESQDCTYFDYKRFRVKSTILP